MSVDDLLARARSRLTRVSAHEAHEAWTAAREPGAPPTSALLVDIRPAAQRAAHGEIPGALIIERNVLEWRLDPASDARLPQASADRPVHVFCQEGYASSLAAEALQDAGLPLATDVDGGFRAWREAGYPTTR